MALHAGIYTARRRPHRDNVNPGGHASACPLARPRHGARIAIIVSPAQAAKAHYHFLIDNRRAGSRAYPASHFTAGDASSSIVSLDEARSTLFGVPIVG